MTRTISWGISRTSILIKVFFWKGRSAHCGERALYWGQKVAGVTEMPLTWARLLLSVTCSVLVTPSFLLGASLHQEQGDIWKQTPMELHTVNLPPTHHWTRSWHVYFFLFDLHSTWQLGVTVPYSIPESLWYPANVQPVLLITDPSLQSPTPFLTQGVLHQVG